MAHLEGGPWPEWPPCLAEARAQHGGDERRDPAAPDGVRRAGGGGGATIAGHREEGKQSGEAAGSAFERLGL